MPSLKAIYRAEAADIALTRLEEFEAIWSKRYPAIGPIWRRAWEHVVPFSRDFTPSIRKMIYTHKLRRGAKPLAAQNHQDPRRLSK